MKSIKKHLLIGFAVLMLVAVSAVAQAATTTEADADTGGLDLPVAIPGANVMADFSLTDDGEVSNVVVLGAPEDSGVSTQQTGISINYTDSVTPPIATDVQASVEIDEEDGVVTGISVDSEDIEAAEEAEIDEPAENDADETEAEEVKEAEDNESSLDDADAAEQIEAPEPPENEGDENGD